MSEEFKPEPGWLGRELEFAKLQDDFDNASKVLMQAHYDAGRHASAAKVAKLFTRAKRFSYEDEIAAVRRAAAEEMRERAAKVADDCDKSTHPADVADRIRALPIEEGVGR